MAVSGINNTYSFFGANVNAWGNMTALTLQRAQIQNGSYGKLLRAYVSKVGNKAALEAYRTTGSTVVSASGLTSGSTETNSSNTISYPKKTIPRSTFLDDHLKSIGKTATSRATAAGTSFLDKHLSEITPETKTGVEKAIAAAEAATGRAINADGEFVDLADKYTSLRSTWLDDHLKSYTADARVQTAADYSVAIDMSV